MALKYFQYISKSKIDLLHQQVLTNRNNFSDISPKISFAGLEFGINLKREGLQDGNLFSNTVALITSLYKQDLIKPITDETKITLVNYYHIESTWHHGLMKWRDSRIELPLVEAYCVFRLVGDALILLIGSPSHLLGYIDATQTQNLNVIRSTTSLMYNSIYRVMGYYVNNPEDTTRIDEEIFISDIRELAFSLDLGTFCLQEVIKLPLKTVDTVFKIYSQYDLRRNAARIAQYAGEEERRGNLRYEMLLDPIKKAEIVGLFKFRNLYIGSPLYTAIP